MTKLTLTWADKWREINDKYPYLDQANKVVLEFELYVRQQEEELNKAWKNKNR